MGYQGTERIGQGYVILDLLRQLDGRGPAEVWLNSLPFVEYLRDRSHSIFVATNECTGEEAGILGLIRWHLGFSRKACETLLGCCVGIQDRRA